MKLRAAMSAALLILVSSAAPSPDWAPVIDVPDAAPEWAPLIDQEADSLDLLRSTLDAFPTENLSMNDRIYKRDFAGNIFRRCSYRQALASWHLYEPASQLAADAMRICERDWQFLAALARAAGSEAIWLDQFRQESVLLVGSVINNCRRLRDGTENPSSDTANSVREREVLRQCRRWAAGEIRP